MHRENAVISSNFSLEKKPPRSTEMADDKTPRGMQQDRKLISLEQDYEVRYWTEALGVSRERLEQLIRAHGHSAEKIREALKNEAACKATGRDGCLLDWQPSGYAALPTNPGPKFSRKYRFMRSNCRIPKESIGEDRRSGE
jgi:hypothetical protein